MTTNGIILAGGKGSRLGPLAAQISKALVSIGNRPQVVNQIEQLRQAGADEIVIVVSPSTRDQVMGVVQRAGLEHVHFVTQKYAYGPAHAVKCGVYALDHINDGSDTIVFMSDTVITESIPEGEWVGIGQSDNASKSFCWTLDGNEYEDSVPPMNGGITIGLYRFDTAQLAAAAVMAMHGHYDMSEVGMAPLLTAYGQVELRRFDTWQDIGDVLSLAKARRERFISRGHHTLQMTTDGLITKSGVSKPEYDFVKEMDAEIPPVRSLFPTLYDDWANAVHAVEVANPLRVEHSYTMEFIDTPSLAELWLYWPGRPELWGDIVRSIITRLDGTLWTRQYEKADEEDMSIFLNKKAQARLQDANIQVSPKFLTDLTTVVGPDVWVRGHGDLNFTNIFYSLNSGGIKLIDPRGGKIPLIYEFAKLAYSPEFSAITHGLYDSLRVLPDRKAEGNAVWNVITDYVDPKRLYATMALIAFAATPLHSEDEQMPLLAHAHEWGTRALDG